ncbi:MAG: hypothetical protein U5K54_12025 [Cytophagales bacterium]|nr:hypothetical protein [Cytophagales bacterium]
MLGIWELNRVAEIKILTGREQRVHPLIILFLLSFFSVLVSSTAALYALYFVLDRPIPLNFDHWKLLLAFGFRVNLFLLNCINAIVFFYESVEESSNRSRTIEETNY